MKEERDWRPRWLGDYTFNSINDQSLLIAPTAQMQYGPALDRLLREIVFADPTLGPFIW